MIGRIEEERRPCEPLLGESQLSIGRSREATYLLKFHGDLRHPPGAINGADEMAVPDPVALDRPIERRQRDSPRRPGPVAPAQRV